MAGREDIFQKSMNMGHSAAWDQQWERAAGFYRQALEEFPDHTGALTSLGLALFELEEYQNSLRCYVRANQLDPNDPLPVEKIAQIYEKLGRIDQAQTAALRAAEMHLKSRDALKAIDSWKFVTRLNPDNVQAHTRLAMVYERMGQKEQAVSELLLLAGLFQRANQLDKAFQAINYSLQLLPGNPQTLDALATLKEHKSLPKPHRVSQVTAPADLDQVRQLEAPLEEAVEISQTPVGEARQKALATLAGMLFENPEAQKKDDLPKKGIQAIVRGADGQSRQQTDPSRILYYLSQLVDLQSRGENTLATRELERAMEIGLDHPAAYFDLGLLHYENGRMESAYRMLQHAVDHPDFALGTRFLMAQILYQLGKVKDASVQYMKALSLADAAVIPESEAKDLLQVYEPIIESQTQIYDPAYHEKVCANISGLLNREDWRAHILRARQQLNAQSSGGTLVPLAEMITQARSSQVVESLARINELAQSGHTMSAMEEAFYALQFAPTYLPLHAFMGDLLASDDHVPEAIEKYTAVAKSYSTRGEARRAVEYYRKIISIAPHDLKAHRQLVSQLIATGQVEDALKEQMNLADVYYHQADLESTRKAYAESLRLCQQYRLDRSWAVEILYRLADIYMQSLDWRQSLQAFEQICALKSDDEKARFSLVDINYRLGQESKALSELDNYLTYLNNQGQKDKIVRFLETLVNEAPGRLAIRRRLADVYRQMGRTSDAVAQLDTIGDQLIRSGDTAGAIRSIEAILALKPENAGQYLRLLDDIKSGKTTTGGA
jgi:tetratricopeptide (TPR) repeat protein